MFNVPTNEKTSYIFHLPKTANQISYRVMGVSDSALYVFPMDNEKKTPLIRKKLLLSHGKANLN